MNEPLVDVSATPEVAAFAKADLRISSPRQPPTALSTVVGREYAIASARGFAADDLLTFTRNAVAAAFITSTRRAALLAELQP